MTLKPYLAIDIETTGLDLQQSQVLQLAAVWDDGASPIEQLKTLNILVDPGRIVGEPFALQMNAPLLKQIADRKGSRAQEAQEIWKSFLLSLNAGKSICAAGKNAAGFDIPMLRNNNFATKLIHHRVIDVGSLYLTNFGYVPTLNQINEITGRPAVSHDALSDCYDVVHAVRYKFKA